MAEQPKVDSIEEIQRKADDFARRQYEEVFKHFEKLLKPSSTNRKDETTSPSQDS